MVQYMVEACKDKNCPKHGTLKVRGVLQKGKVVSTKAKKTAVVEIQYIRFVPKYERYEKRKSRVKVHVPECVSVKEGDSVKIGECRRISKTKSRVIIS